MPALIAGLLFFLFFQKVYGHQKNLIEIENLSALISEYEDCEVSLLLFSPDSTIFDPITTTPVIIDSPRLRKQNRLGLPAFLKLFRRRKRNFNYSLFLILPEDEFNKFSDLKTYLRPYNSGLPPAANVYLNVLTRMGSRLKIEGSFLRVIFYSVKWPDNVNEYGAIYYLIRNADNERSLSTHTYKVAFLEMCLHFPAVDSRKTYYTQFKLIRLPSSCFINQTTFCRKVIQQKMDDIFAAGKFMVDHRHTAGGGWFPKYVGDVRVFYLNKSSLPSHFVSLSSITIPHLNNPFKPYSANFELKTLLRFLLLEALEISIDFEYPNEIGLFDMSLIGLLNDPLRLVSIITRDMFDIGLTPFRNKENYFILTGDTFDNFLTCDGVGQSISFQFYVGPYDFLSWITFLSISFLLLPFVSLLLLKLKSRIAVPLKWKKKLNLVLDVILFDIAAALEISPNFTKMISSVPRLTFILGLWTLLTVIIVNAYKGIVTSETTAPYPVTGKYKKLNEMEGFAFMASLNFMHKFYDLKTDGRFLSAYKLAQVTNLRGCLCYPDAPEIVPGLCRSSHWYNTGDELKKIRSDSCATVKAYLGALDMEIKHLPATNFCEDLHGDENMKRFVEEYKQNGVLRRPKPHDHCHPIWAIDATNLSSSKTNFPLLFKKALLFFRVASDSGTTDTSDTHIANTLSDCHKTAYIDSDQELDSITMHAETCIARNLNFRKGNEKLFYMWKGYHFWHVYRVQPLLFARFQQLLCHGIYHIWEKWYNMNQPTLGQRLRQLTLRKMRSRNREKPLDIKSNIGTIFFIYFALILISSFLLTIELLTTVFFIVVTFYSALSSFRIH